MAKGVEGFGETAVAESSTTDTAANGNAEPSNNVDKESGSNSEFRMEEVSDTLSKLTLNPMAEEFIPSSYLVMSPNSDQFGPADGFTPVNYQFFGSEGYPFNRRSIHFIKSHSIKITSLNTGMNQNHQNLRLELLKKHTGFRAYRHTCRSRPALGAGTESVLDSVVENPKGHPAQTIKHKTRMKSGTNHSTHGVKHLKMG